MLDGTLTRLHEQRSVRSERSLVLFCPPLRRESVERDRRWWTGINRLLNRRREFVRQVFETNGWTKWPEYERHLVLPVLAEFCEIRERSAATLMIEVTFAQFCESVMCGRYELLILIAHHLSGPLDETPSGQIEFADGGYAWTDVDAVLRRMPNRAIASFVLCVCNSAAWSEHLTESAERLSAGGSDTRMPLLETVRFVRFWIESLDGRTPLWLAHGRAIRRHLEKGA